LDHKQNIESQVEATCCGGAARPRQSFNLGGGETIITTTILTIITALI